MQNNYNGPGAFIKDWRLNQAEGFFVDKTGKRSAQRNRNFTNFPQSKSQTEMKRNPPVATKDSELQETTEGKSDNTPVAPTVEVLVHAYGEKTESVPQCLDGFLQILTEVNQEDILRGIVMSEILGKPRALRRSRWQIGNKGSYR